MTDRPLAAIVLAGGEGTRLRAFVRGLAGDDRPKQFCAVLGGDTLLAGTRRRAAMLVEPERLVTVVTSAHERYFTPALRGIAPETVVVQPASRGTAPAMLYGLMRLRALGHEGPVALLPSDHYVSDDRVFMSAVAEAAAATARHPERIVLLGIRPDRPETEYGWIEPAERLPGTLACPVYAVRRFWEKPGLDASARLHEAGALWNTFVMVGEPPAFEAAIRRAAPALVEAFGPLGATPGTRDDVETIYDAAPAVDFSRDVLQRQPGALGVLAVSDVEWNDLGDPERVRAARRQHARRMVTA